MLDKLNFMETLRSVAELTRTSNKPLPKEEIESYFEGMELTPEQHEMIYEYLLNPQLGEPEPENTNEENEPSEDNDDTEEEQAEAEVQETEAEAEPVSAFLQMYLEDLADIPTMSEEEEEHAYGRLLSGDETVIQSISNHWLTKVVDIAKTYEKRKVNLEDVIQEGNIGLLRGIKSLLGNGGAIDTIGFLTNSIKESMEAYIDEIMNDEDWESTVVAKTTLIHEAKKALTDQLGHVPSIHELADYTKMDVEEIQDLISLTKEKKSN